MAAAPPPPEDESDGAEAYERLLVPGLFMPSTRLAVALAAPRPGERLLDLACGTGIGARTAASALGGGGGAVGVDLDAAMLRVARRSAAAAAWVRASALQLPLRDAAFDLVLCLQGLQFVADPVQALREAHRVLRPSGRIVATAWGPLEANPGHAAVYAALDAHGIDTRSPRRGFALGIGELHALARAAGFGVVGVSAHDGEAAYASPSRFVDGIMLGAPYTRRVLAARPPALREDCARDAVQRLAGRTAGDAFLLPTRCHVLVARR